MTLEADINGNSSIEGVDDLGADLLVDGRQSYVGPQDAPPIFGNVELVSWKQVFKDLSSDLEWYGEEVG